MCRSGERRARRLHHDCYHHPQHSRRPCHLLGADASRHLSGEGIPLEHLHEPAATADPVPAYVFVRMFEPLLPIGLGFAAGAMIWMVFAELIPDALKSAASGSIGITVAPALTALWLRQHFVLSH